MIEHLVCCAIARDGVVHRDGDWRSHWRLRAAMGDEQPSQRKLNDEEGYWTSAGRFVDRVEASRVGYAAGQCMHPDVRLLSSEVEWDAKVPHKPADGGPKLRRKRVFRP